MPTQDAIRHAFFDFLPEAGIIIDVATGQILDCNNRAAAMLEYDREALVGLPLTRIVEALTQRQFDSWVADNRASVEILDLNIWLRRKSGALVESSFLAQFGDVEGERVLFGVARPA